MLLMAIAIINLMKTIGSNSCWASKIISLKVGGEGGGGRVVKLTVEVYREGTIFTSLILRPSLGMRLDFCIHMLCKSCEHVQYQDEHSRLAYFYCHYFNCHTLSALSQYCW